MEIGIQSATIRKAITIPENLQDASLGEKFKEAKIKFLNVVLNQKPTEMKNILEGWKYYIEVTEIDGKIRRKRSDAQAIHQVLENASLSDSTITPINIKPIEIDDHIKEELALFVAATYRNYPEGEEVGNLFKGLGEEHLPQAVEFCKTMVKKFNSEDLTRISLKRRVFSMLNKSLGLSHLHLQNQQQK